MAKKLPLKPLNDFLLVEIVATKYTTSAGDLDVANKDDNESVQRGVCVDVGITPYRSMSGWVLPETNAKEEREQFIGKTLLWQKYADKDATFEYEGRTFVLIKVAQVVAYEQ